MTLEEKKEFCDNYCCSVYDCGDCMFDGDNRAWCQEYNTHNAPEELLDYSVKKIKESANFNAVDHPSHYNQGGIECIDAMVSAFGKDAVADFCIINAFKYVWRASEKNGTEDINKAIWYLTKYKELKDGESNEAN